MSDKAADVLTFFRRALCHVKGSFAGRPLEPDRWQVEQILRPLFGTLRPDGLRQYRTCYVEIPRKNGKSTIAAGVALYLLFADREPGAEVISAAGDREQAHIVFDLARSMVEASPVLSGRCKVYRKEITVPGTGSRYRAISADAPTKHGMNAHGIIFDELHTQPTRELWDVLTTSTGARRQPVTFAITTAGHDRDSICYEVHSYALQVRDGVVQDPTFLPVIYAAPEDADWRLESTWRKANPGYGVSVTEDYFRQASAEAQALPQKEQTFRRLHLCQWTENATRWLPLDRWDACSGGADPEALHGRACYAGLDLASTTDLAALVLAFPDDASGYDVLPFFFAPAEACKKRERLNKARLDGWARSGHLTLTEGDVIDYDVIRRKVNDLHATYQIREIAIDRWNATHLATQLQGDGFSVVAFGQGFASMSAPAKELEKLVLAGAIRHGGHPVLRWNAANAAVRTDAAGNLKPDKERSGDKIDGVCALVMALGRAMLTPSGSVYESRGVEVLGASATPRGEEEYRW